MDYFECPWKIEQSLFCVRKILSWLRYFILLHMLQKDINGGGKGFNRDEEEEDEEEANGRGRDAWERTYTDERSWEALQEDESGLLRPIDNKAIQHAQYRRRLRTASAVRIQKGLIRYLYVVLDFSRVSEWFIY